MKINFIVIAILLLVQIHSLKMLLFLGYSDGPKCFYQYLKNGEKYAFNAKGYSQQRYRMDIYRQSGNKWEEVYSRQSPSSIQSLNKLAESQATYMFCISNMQEGILKVKIQIMSGFELGSTDSLPTKGDHQLLDQQIGWIQHQKIKLIDSINRIGQGQNSAESVRSSSSRTMLVLAFVGMAVVVGINLVFFNRAKKELKDRKLI